jgi:hypothetical protein
MGEDGPPIMIRAVPPHSKSISGWVGSALALLLLVAGAAEAASPPFPRLGLYGRVRGNGFPLLQDDGTLNDTTLDQHARYDELVIEASPCGDHRPDILAALRARHPGISLLAYVAGHLTWFNPAVDTLTDYPYHYWQTVRDLDGFLYNRQGELFPLCNVNIAKKVGGRYVVAEALADLIYRDIISTGLWDGVFLDIFCDDVRWVETSSDSFDYVRAGYPTNAAFHQAWGEAHSVYGNRLRSLAGDNAFVLVGNCGHSTLYSAFNGWMREGFPFQNGGTWTSNMFRQVGGYFPDDRHFRAPPHNYLFSAADPPSDPYSVLNRRKVRFGLGSAALGEGFGVFGYSDRDVVDYPYYGWWYDEYAVDLATGRSSSSLAHTGYLGQALGPYYQMAWLTGNPDAVANPDFETDLSGWDFAQYVPATFTRDQGPTPDGSWSARVHVGQTAAEAYYVRLATIGTIPVTAYRYYSATFWAKAAVPRTFTVGMGLSGVGMLATQETDLTAEWTRYQIVLAAQTSGTAQLQFFFANALGDVWLDDVHFQEGVANVYRRDFQNGIVLVNPLGTPMTVALERPFHKIQGTVSPDVNDGSTVTAVTLAPSDALFLLGDDVLAPAPVTDMRPRP